MLATVWLFFMVSGFGFVHIAALHWLLFVGGLNLLIALTVWLCREKLQRPGAKIALIVGSVLAELAVAFVFFIVSVFMALSGTTMYRSYEISRSPEGSNRVIVYATGSESNIVVANPMVNRWVYRRQQQHSVDLFGGNFSLRVEWLGEHRAVVRPFTNSGEEYELLGGLIVVEF